MAGKNNRNIPNDSDLLAFTQRCLNDLLQSEGDGGQLLFLKKDDTIELTEMKERFDSTRKKVRQIKEKAVRKMHDASQKKT